MAALYCKQGCSRTRPTVVVVCQISPLLYAAHDVWNVDVGNPDHVCCGASLQSHNCTLVPLALMVLRSASTQCAVSPLYISMPSTLHRCCTDPLQSHNCILVPTFPAVFRSASRHL